MEEENFLFRLSAYQDRLLKLYDEQPGFIGPETRRNEVASFVRSGLKADDKVVLDGLANPMVRPGAKIVPQKAQIAAKP